MVKRRAIRLVLVSWPCIIACSTPEPVAGWEQRLGRIVASRGGGGLEVSPDLSGAPTYGMEARFVLSMPEEPSSTTRLAITVLPDEPLRVNYIVRSLDSSLFSIRMQSRAADAVIRVESEGQAPVEFHSRIPIGLMASRNMVQACQCVQPADANMAVSPAEIEAPLLQQARALHCTFGLLDLVESCEPLRDLLLRVVGRPSLWSVVTSGFRVNVGIVVRYQNATPTAVGELSGWLVPFEIKLNGSPAFHGVFLALAPEGALAYSAGIVDVAGCRPSDPDKVVRLQLESVRVLDAAARRNEIPIDVYEWVERH